LIENFLRTLALCLCLAAADARTSPLPPDPYFGTPPSKSVLQWTRISALGDRNAILVIVWVSPRFFERSAFEELSVLPMKEYESFVSFAHSYPCSSPVKEFHFGALMITVHSHSTEAVCALPPSKSCSFLRRAIELKKIVWTEARLKPFRDISNNIACHLPILR
jgi:hypothetical protein